MLVNSASEETNATSSISWQTDVTLLVQFTCHPLPSIFLYLAFEETTNCQVAMRRYLIPSFELDSLFTFDSGLVVRWKSRPLAGAAIKVGEFGFWGDYTPSIISRLFVTPSGLFGDGYLIWISQQSTWDSFVVHYHLERVKYNLDLEVNWVLRQSTRCKTFFNCFECGSTTGSPWFSTTINMRQYSIPFL